ncbi:F510_1955 family glycosylhydrolase (plasmid) [Metabacillus halosaccharovorans]|uniref:F510_1955 family glycosylhydrolase n=1 Tax=Metabacillus halosaccharovorans TaxID=930124 RepID=UPI000C80AB62|nr:sialidase [Metabacillus halosaccharovorans]MCM3441524.1 sialidase [Metabacillus halosaccharovorans]PMC36366.1 sialidase [Bacillus sp. UMB0899]
MNNLKCGLLFFPAMALLLAACSNDEPKEYFIKADNEKIEHIHGAGFWGPEGTPVIATHYGPLEFKDNTWYKTSRNNHDYMGFQPTKNGFYSSGHPEEGSGLKNPLGLVESTNKGESLEQLAFYGETDFHYLGASYEKGTVYVFNENQNSKIGPGFYYSKNKGKDWTQLKLNGMTSRSIGGFEIHPSKDNIIAIYAEEGIFLSENYGNDFLLIPTEAMVTSLTFKEDSLIYSKLENDKVSLHEVTLSSQEDRLLTAPSLNSGNVPIYLEANSSREEELMIVTLKNDVYLNEGQKKWNKILSDGEIK